MSLRRTWLVRQHSGALVDVSYGSIDDMSEPTPRDKVRWPWLLLAGATAVWLYPGLMFLLGSGPEIHGMTAIESNLFLLMTMAMLVVFLSSIVAAVAIVVSPAQRSKQAVFAALLGLSTIVSVVVPALR